MPFNTGHVNFDSEMFAFRGMRYEMMHLRARVKPDIKFGAGSLNQDARGRWYINLPIEVEGAGPRSQHPRRHRPRPQDAGRPAGRKSEAKLAVIQRACKAPERIGNIHAKIANRAEGFPAQGEREDRQKLRVHRRRRCQPVEMAKTNMAKGVLDAGWSGLEHMPLYKAITDGGMRLEVNEAYTSQACSECGCAPASRPKGTADLGVRGWTCDDCGAVYNRDVNAARNILGLGLEQLAGGAHV